MNKRILELAEQANELDYETFDEYNHKIVKHYKFNKEKFARLIVSECAGIIEAIDNGNQIEGTDNPIKAIRKRFGV